MTAATDQALLALLNRLADRGYSFVTTSPASHARVLARPDDGARDLRDIFGWSRDFSVDDVDPELMALMRQARIVERKHGRLRSRIRVSSLDGLLFLHSAYPTEAADSVFFGPDSYRFAALIGREIERAPLRPGARIADVGAGAGVGGIVAARRAPGAELVMTDINPVALGPARVNARFAGVEAQLVETEGLARAAGRFDLIIANPPYIVDEGERAYRDGGALHGGEVSLAMAREAAGRLEPGGRLILYTGAAIIAGRNPLCEALRDALQGLAFECREIDPDVFGEELDKPAYRGVERIAVIAAIARRT